MLRTAALIILTLGLTRVSGEAYDEPTGIRNSYYVAVTYCHEETISSWDCGDPCRNGPQIAEITVV